MDVKKEINKKLGPKGLNKFENSMKKYARISGENGIKKLQGKGIYGYLYEVKIKGDGGAYRLLEKATETDEFLWEKFSKTHK